MTDNHHTNNGHQRLALHDSVQIYYNGADELRLRKGVWNFEEAILTFAGLSDAHKDTLVKIFDQFQDGTGVDAERLPDEHNLTQLEREQIVQTLDALQANDYVSDGNDADARHFLTQLLGGITDYAPGQNGVFEQIAVYKNGSLYKSAYRTLPPNGILASGSDTVGITIQDKCSGTDVYTAYVNSPCNATILNSTNTWFMGTMV